MLRPVTIWTLAGKCSKKNIKKYNKITYIKKKVLKKRHQLRKLEKKFIKIKQFRGKIIYPYINEDTRLWI